MPDPSESRVPRPTAGFAVVLVICTFRTAEPFVIVSPGVKRTVVLPDCEDGEFVYAK